MGDINQHPSLLYMLITHSELLPSMIEDKSHSVTVTMKPLSAVNVSAQNKK